MPGTYDFLNRIAGSKLSGITFVLDYLQFHFDGPRFDVLTPVTVASAAGHAASGEDQFRNLVCGQIGKVVLSVTVQQGEAIVVTYEDGSEVRFSLRQQDYPGPEAVIFDGSDGEWGVF